MLFIDIVDFRSYYLDILLGSSGFRSLNEVVRKLSNNSTFAPVFPNVEMPFRIEEKEKEKERGKEKIDRTKEQWYDSDGGRVLCRQINDKLEMIAPHIVISRDTVSYNLSIDIDDKVSLHFPADFPASPMSISWTGDISSFTKNPNEIADVICDRICNILHKVEEKNIQVSNV